MKLKKNFTADTYSSHNGKTNITFGIIKISNIHPYCKYVVELLSVKNIANFQKSQVFHKYFKGGKSSHKLPSIIK